MRKTLTRTFNLEQLEKRELMASDIAAVLNGGVLRITGTENADQILIRKVNQEIQVSGVSITDATGQTVIPSSSAVDAIMIDALSGNDLIWVDNNIALTIDAHGGAGFDLIRAGTGATLTSDADQQDSMDKVVAEIWKKIESEKLTPNAEGRFALQNLRVGGVTLTSATIALNETGVAIRGTLKIDGLPEVSVNGTIDPHSKTFELSGDLPVKSLFGNLVKFEGAKVVVNQKGLNVNATATIANLGKVAFTANAKPDGTYSFGAKHDFKIAGFDVKGGAITVGDKALDVSFNMPIAGIGDGKVPVEFDASYGPSGWSVRGSYPLPVQIGPVTLKSIVVGISHSEVNGNSISLGAKATVAGIDGFVDADAKATVYSDGRFDMRIDANALKVGGFTLGNVDVTLNNLASKRVFVTTIAGDVSIPGMEKAIRFESIVDSRGNYTLGAEQNFTFGGIKFSEAEITLSKSTGMKFSAIVKLQSLTLKIDGGITAKGAIWAHADTVNLPSKFALDEVQLEIDFNAQKRLYSLHLEGTCKLAIAEVDVSVDVKSNGVTWPELVLTGHEKIGGALSKAFVGDVEFTIGKDSVRIQGDAAIRYLPGKAIDLDATLTSHGTLTISGHKFNIADLAHDNWLVIGETILAAGASFSDVVLATWKSGGINKAIEFLKNGNIDQIAKALNRAFDSYGARGVCEAVSTMPVGDQVQILIRISDTAGFQRIRVVLNEFNVSQIHRVVADAIGDGNVKWAADALWSLPGFDKMIPVISKLSTGNAVDVLLAFNDYQKIADTVVNAVSSGRAKWIGEVLWSTPGFDTIAGTLSKMGVGHIVDVLETFDDKSRILRTLEHLNYTLRTAVMKELGYAGIKVTYGPFGMSISSSGSSISLGGFKISF